jgi:peptide-methionine (S)-S-oxide reductase
MTRKILPLKTRFVTLLAIVIGFLSLNALPTLAEPVYKTATFAGGCFWCMEKPFDVIDGVVSSISGYTGGSKVNPTYREVSGGNTGHTESVQITYDPEKVKYETLLNTFWHNIDPIDAQGQFCDKGSQYRSAIFYGDEDQKKLAETAKSELDKGGKLEGAIVTEITPASTFYPAEDYHQNYYETNTLKYKLYRFSCGRDKRLESLWGADAGY